MSQEQGVPEYNYDDYGIAVMSPDKICGFEFDCQNGAHFRLCCGKYHSLLELKDRLTEIIGMSSTKFQYFMGDVLINPKDKFGKFCDPLIFKWIKIKALFKDIVHDSIYDVQYVNCFFLTKEFKSIGGEFVGIKSIEDYGDFLRARLGLRELKFYDFLDVYGNPIDPKAPLDKILCRTVMVKEKPTPESFMKKLTKLLAWCEPHNE